MGEGKAVVAEFVGAGAGAVRECLLLRSTSTLSRFRALVCRLSFYFSPVTM